jgi:heme/copper-type cytochrome/quinol oxidase subunit 1
MPMHFLGLASMPRRIPDYPDAFTGWNLVASYGSIVTTIGLLIFLYNVFITIAFTDTKFYLSNNYWYSPDFFNFSYKNKMFDNLTNSATTLEWVLQSPPSYHSYIELPKTS